MQSQRTWGYHHLHFWGIQRDIEWMIIFSADLWSTDIALCASAFRVVQTIHVCISRICFIGFPAFLFAFLSLSPVRAWWWQAFQIAGNGLALKWNWSLWKCLESWLIWEEAKRLGEKITLYIGRPLWWINRIEKEERNSFEKANWYKRNSIVKMYSPILSIQYPNLEDNRVIRRPWGKRSGQVGDMLHL